MERRRFTRYPSDIPIEFQAENMLGFHHHMLRDAGCGGLSFHAAGWIAPNTRLRICIPFGNSACNAWGKVAWCRKDSKGQFLVGIEFAQRVAAASIGQLHQIERFKRRARKRGVRLTGDEAVSRLEPGGARGH